MVDLSTGVSMPSPLPVSRQLEMPGVLCALCRAKLVALVPSISALHLDCQDRCAIQGCVMAHPALPLNDGHACSAAGPSLAELPLQLVLGLHVLIALPQVSRIPSICTPRSTSCHLCRCQTPRTP